MQKIVPHLWYDKEAKEAADFYVSVFGGASEVASYSQLHNTPSGDVDVLAFSLWGYTFNAISAGPLFRFTPSISISVQCHSEEEIERIHAALGNGGTILMPLAAYPWSVKYAWINDRYGLSWQLNLPADQTITTRIMPHLMFSGANTGKAEEAMAFYASVFPDSKVGEIWRYGADQAPDKEGTVTHAEFTLGGETLSAMDSARMHAFSFTEALSLIVRCKTQEEIDRYWAALSAVPEAEQCGWLKDRYGLSWQIVPTIMDEILTGSDDAEKARVTAAFLKMKKFDIAALEAAAKGE